MSIGQARSTFSQRLDLNGCGKLWSQSVNGEKSKLVKACRREVEKCLPINDNVKSNVLNLLSSFA